MDVFTQKMVKQDKAMKMVYTVCGLLIIAITVAIGAFLLFKGCGTFTTAGHSVTEFLFSSQWAPKDSSSEFGGQVGALVYIAGSLLTCGLALVICIPFSVGSAVFLSEINPKLGEKIFRPAVEIYVGIPSVVYGWIGLTVLVPFIRDVFHAKMGGFSVLAASIVLAVMIFPTITTVAADAIKSVPDGYREAAYGMGSTRWQVIRHVVLPSAFSGIATGVIMAAGRGFGEAAALLYTSGQSTVINWSNWNLTSPTCPLNPFRAGETLSLHIWVMRTEGSLNPNATAIATFSSAILVLLTLSFSVITRRMSDRIQKKNQKGS